MAASARNAPFTLRKSTHSSSFSSNVTSTKKHTRTSLITLHRATDLSLSSGFPRLYTSLCSSLPLPASMSAFPTHIAAQPGPGRDEGLLVGEKGFPV